MAAKKKEIIIERSNKTVYREGDVLVKVFAKEHAKSGVFNEAHITSLVESYGVPCAPVRFVKEIDGKWGIGVDYIEGVTLAEKMKNEPENYDALLEKFVEIQVAVSKFKAVGLRNTVDKRAEEINALPDLDPSTRYELMQRLAAGGIEMECQIVCCLGINDGEALDRSMRELAALWPEVNSVSVVPVGLTKHREKLPVLQPFDREKALETVRQVEAFGDDCLRRLGSRVFFCADELYLKAGLEPPEDAWYEGYPQLENGVGLLRLLATEFESCLSRGVESDGKPFSVATGVAAAPFLRRLLARARESCAIIKGEVYAVENDFLGSSIDVAGLVTGGDLIGQLRGRALGERLLIPVNMLRHGEGVFLDDVTLEDVTAALGVPVRVVAQDGGDLLEAMCGR